MAKLLWKKLNPWSCLQQIKIFSIKSTNLMLLEVKSRRILNFFISPFSLLESTRITSSLIRKIRIRRNSRSWKIEAFSAFKAEIFWCPRYGDSRFTSRFKRSKSWACLELRSLKHPWRLQADKITNSTTSSRIWQTDSFSTRCLDAWAFWHFLFWIKSKASSV